MPLVDKTHPLLQKEEKYSAHNYHPLPVVLSHARGVWYWDDMGDRYLDMMSAYSAVSHGHGHPRILAALTNQAQKLCVPSRAYYNDQLANFTEKVAKITGMNKVLPMNTGAEAVETAIKAARRWGYKVKGIPENKAEIITARGNFHGRTTTIISFSTEEANRDGFGPFTPGFVNVDFGDINQIADAINKNTAAVILEPIQGEAGIIIPPQGYLTAVKKLCAENNVLFILDEVQSGMGRTGKMFAFQHEGVGPDGIILGKALGGGVLPISCFAAKSEVMDVFTPGSHGSTFGGNPLACHVAIEAINVIEEEKLVERCEKLGAYLLEKLNAISHPYIEEVRGIGLWFGVDVNIEMMGAHEFCKMLIKNGILTKETREHTLRLAPPLVINENELDWFIERFTKTLNELDT